ncbi:CDP-glycerol glycerophosphotransferase family protein [Bacillus sp. N9]
MKAVPVHSNYTNVYVSSENVIKHYAEAFNMDPKNIYPLGVPRTDMFLTQSIRLRLLRK